MVLLRSKVQVQALIRRAEANGAFALVQKSGDDDAGGVLVLVNRLDGTAALLGQARDEDFNRVWEYLCPPKTDTKLVDDVIAKHLRFDPDLWVIEIEDRKGRHFLVEDVLAANNGPA